MRVVSRCMICRRWFAFDDERQVACTVRHGRNECCHYGQEEIEDPERAGGRT